MKIVSITPEEKRRILSFAQKVIKDAGENSKAAWKLKRNYTIASMCIGTIGELAYAKMTGQRVNMTLKTFGDKGIDFPDGAQVKTCTYNGPYKKELKVSSLKFKIIPKKFILAHYNAANKSNFVAMLGEISYENFLSKKKVKYFNEKPSFVVSEDELDKYY